MLSTATRPPQAVACDPVGVLNALAHPVIVMDAFNRVISANASAENLFDISEANLRGQPLEAFLPGDCPVFDLIAQCRNSGGTVSGFDLSIDSPRTGAQLISCEVAPLPDQPEYLVLSLMLRSIARKLDRQLTHRSAARSVTGMAEMLAHEVKNPLSGIRGAAQLLESVVDSRDRNLTRLIIDEVDRICGLVARMEAFSDPAPLARDAVNIHEILERVRRSAQSGFGAHVRFLERYDPSLPPVLGNRDQLIQVFLNLVKNAAEAAPHDGAEITLSTGYQQGTRLAITGADRRTHLPLLVSIQDNGPGIPEDIRSNLFDPFITSKQNGTGLGLALVAKIIGDHGGMIEFDSQPRRTVFRVMLPMATIGGNGIDARA
ncbi:MAG: two-component system sensor histidine kinase NtrB [Elsteraceae bacterium]